MARKKKQIENMNDAELFAALTRAQVKFADLGEGRYSVRTPEGGRSDIYATDLTCALYEACCLLGIKE